jgi:predicted small metal-binding protein
LAGQVGFEPASGDLDSHPAAELDARRIHRSQPCCKVLAMAPVDNCQHQLRETEMAKIINCECGHVARGDTDDEVLADLEAHMRRAHPELVGKYTRDDLFDLIEED